MNVQALTMNSLFAQLGLGSSDTAIMDFIHAHAPLSLTIPLHALPFWTNVQAAFLRQAIADDSDWCVVVDQLDAHLRRDFSVAN